MQLTSRCAFLMGLHAGTTIAQTTAQPNAGSQTCYWPNGVAGNNTYYVCNPRAEFSACCVSADMCTTNGLCRPERYVEDNLFSRNACTDPTWQSPQCPQFCYNSTTDPLANSTSWQVRACSQTTYCCGSGDCCDDLDNVFDAGPASYLSGPTFSTSLFAATMTPSSWSTSASASPSTTMSANASPSGSNTPSPSSNGSQTPSPTMNSTPSIESSAERKNTESGINVGGIAGGVVGGVVALALVGAVLWLVYRKRRDRKPVMRQIDYYDGK